MKFVKSVSAVYEFVISESVLGEVLRYFNAPSPTMRFHPFTFPFFFLSLSLSISFPFFLREEVDDDAHG